MQEEFKILFSDQVNRYGLFLSLGLVVLGLVFFLIKVLSLPPLVPLFYNRPWGMMQLSAPFQLFLLLLASILVFVINGILASKLYKKAALLSRILIWVSALVSFLATTSIIRIILLIV